jgi:glucose-6-phosphate 1-dehydrogenase
MSGDPTLFARRDEVEHAWEFVDAIEQAWHAGDGKAPALCTYPAGSWGPAEAEALIERDGRKWRRL